MGGLGKWVRRRARLCKKQTGDLSLFPVSTLSTEASKVEEKRCFAPQPMLLRPMRPNNESNCLHGTAHTPPDWSNLALGCHPSPSPDSCALPALWLFLFCFSLVLSGSAHVLNVKARTGKFCFFPLVPIRFDS